LGDTSGGAQQVVLSAAAKPVHYETSAVFTWHEFVLLLIGLGLFAGSGLALRKATRVSD
jgi:hypothetical protein